MNHNHQKTVFVMHNGGDQVRGSEICLLHTINSMLEANYQILLFRNNSIIDPILPKNDRLTLVDFNYDELMIDGAPISLPIMAYLSGLKKIFTFVQRYKPIGFFCNGGLPCQTAVVVGKLTNTPVMCHFHHPSSKRYFYLWLVKYVKQLIYPSQYTRSIVQKNCGRDGIVIYNAVDLIHRYTPALEKSNTLKRQLSINDDTLVVGQIAALVPHKRPDLLMKCFAELHQKIPNSHLLIIGTGEMQQTLIKLRSTLALDNAVSITGYVEDTLPYLQHIIDINVLASTEEGLGISVIEAAGCGVPSIVTDCTGLSEVVEHENTGLKFDMNDSDSLTSSLYSLATRPELRTKYGQAARQLALEKFNLNSYKTGIISSIQTLSH